MFIVMVSNHVMVTECGYRCGWGGARVLCFAHLFPSVMSIMCCVGNHPKFKPCCNIVVKDIPFRRFCVPAGFWGVGAVRHRQKKREATEP